MIRLLAILLGLAALIAQPLSAQVPDSRPASRPAGEEEPQDEEEGFERFSQEEREAHLDLTIPKHDEASYVKDEKTGVAWSFLRRGPEDAPKLRFGDRVRAHTTSWIAKDGTELSSTRRRPGKGPNPEVLDTGAFIRGLNLVMPHMRPGDKVRIDIPAAMAFGEKGMRSRIPPNTDLIYALQVLKVVGHCDIPEFVAFDEDKCTKLDDGSAFMILADGAGLPAGDKAAVSFEFVMRDEEGNVIDTSLTPRKAPIGGQVGALRLPAMNAVGRIARPGGHYLVRLPFKMVFPGEVLSLVDPNGTWMFLDLMTKDIAPFLSAEDEKMQSDKNGFRYVVLREGTGEKIKPDDRVHIHYAYFTFPDGNLVDASYTRGFTNNFRQVGLTAGMRQAVAKLAPGGMIRARIPAALAWGATGRVGVPADTDILLQLELFPEALPTDEPRDEKWRALAFPKKGGDEKDEAPAPKDGEER